jgi:hypothetical protein
VLFNAPDQEAQAQTQQQGEFQDRGQVPRREQCQKYSQNHQITSICDELYFKNAQGDNYQLSSDVFFR